MESPVIPLDVSQTEDPGESTASAIGWLTTRSPNLPSASNGRRPA